MGSSFFDQEYLQNYDDVIAKDIPTYAAFPLLAAATLSPELQENAKLLIVGSGTGNELFKLADYFKSIDIVALDVESFLLTTLQEKCGQQGLGPRVSFHQGEVSSLPDKAQFNAATSILVMHFLLPVEKIAYLKSIYDRLLPNGRLFLVDISDSTQAQEKKFCIRHGLRICN